MCAARRTQPPRRIHSMSPRVSSSGARTAATSRYAPIAQNRAQVGGHPVHRSHLPHVGGVRETGVLRPDPRVGDRPHEPPEAAHRPRHPRTARRACVNPLTQREPDTIARTSAWRWRAFKRLLSFLRPVCRGREQIGDYFRRGLARFTSLCFEVVSVTEDAERDRVPPPLERRRRSPPSISSSSSSGAAGRSRRCGCFTSDKHDPRAVRRMPRRHVSGSTSPNRSPARWPGTAPR